jgi:hypothetical protein
MPNIASNVMVTETRYIGKSGNGLLRLSNCFQTVEVVIALDLPADQVRAIYRQYWDLKHMYELATNLVAEPLYMRESNMVQNLLYFSLE